MFVNNIETRYLIKIVKPNRFDNVKGVVRKCFVYC